MTIWQAVKLVDQRDGTKLIGGKVKKVGKTKTTTSKRVVPLNSTAIEMIYDLRKEFYFGEDTPTERSETDATVCEIDAHFRHNYLNHKTTRRYQKYNLKLLKIAIDAQKMKIAALNF